MTDMELLNWARGPALEISLIIFIAGIVLRFLEIFLLGRKKDLSEPRQGGFMAGVTTVIMRSVEHHAGRPLDLVMAYTFHIGFLVVLFFFVPHILLFKDAFGLSWPGIPNGIADALTIISLLAMMYILAVRIMHPVRRMLSNFNDYFAWLLTFLPLLTGYLAFHRYGGDYTFMLALHVLSVNLLLVAFPFTKLTHAFTLVLARWYSGATSGRKGVQI